jgi:hypothetical protein
MKSAVRGGGSRQHVDGRTVAVWAAAVAAGAVIQALLWLVSEPAVRFSDFYKAYYPVAESLWFDGARDTWPLAETGAGSFVNLPIVGWLFVPLVAFGEDNAGWAYLALGVAAVAGIWFLLSRLGRTDRATGPVLLLLILCNGPLVNSLREGNSTHFILLLLIAVLMLQAAGCSFAAGLVLGFCAIMKLPLLLYGLYFLVRGQWRVVAGGAMAIVLTGLLSLAVHGLDANVGWYGDSVAPFLGGVIPAFNVQSIDGFLMRLQTGTGALMDWLPHVPSIFHVIARTLAVAGLLCGSYWLMRRARAPRPGDRAAERDVLEYVLVLNLAIVISPISWSHYYLFLLLPWALYLCGRLDLPDDAMTNCLMWGGIVLSSLPVVILPLRPDWFGELMARTVVSACLFGGLLTLAALIRSLWHLSRSERSS